MSKTTSVLLLIIFILGIYYPAIFAGVNSLDDFRMLDELPVSGKLDVLSLFNPFLASGYFRPLIILSYYLDSSILNLVPQAMHFENILIHLINTLLMFSVGLAVFRAHKTRIELAFTAACLFGLHPLNVEAVAWISGRTDPLATMFGLLALVCIYRFADSAKYSWLWSSALLCLTGALAKETALFCLPAGFLLACANDVQLRAVFSAKSWRAFVVRAHWMVLPFILTGVAYITVRMTTLKYVTKIVTNVSGAGSGENSINSVFRLTREVLITYGFYIKKIFQPLPLNFAITEVSDNYLWLGSVIMLLLIYCVIRRMDSVAVQMMFATLIVMVSAIIISRAKIAWTPYAERYLYLPTVFFSFGIVDAGYLFSCRFLNRRTTVITIFAVLGLTAVITSKRSIIWQNNLTLYQDTISKSPNFGCISNELAIALAADNRTVEAIAQIELGKKASSQGDMVLLYVNQASILGEKKQYEEAYKVLDCTYKGRGVGQAHIEVIKSYIHLMEREQIETKDHKRSAKLLNTLADLHELYYKKSGDTDHLYRAGQLAMAAGNKSKAHTFFVEVADHAPKESMYKDFARKMAIKTEKLYHPKPLSR